MSFVEVMDLLLTIVPLKTMLLLWVVVSIGLVRKVQLQILDLKITLQCVPILVHLQVQLLKVEQFIGVVLMEKLIIVTLLRILPVILVVQSIIKVPIISPLKIHISIKTWITDMEKALVVVQSISHTLVMPVLWTVTLLRIQLKVLVVQFILIKIVKISQLRIHLSLRTMLKVLVVIPQVLLHNLMVVEQFSGEVLTVHLRMWISLRISLMLVEQFIILKMLVISQ